MSAGLLVGIVFGLRGRPITTRLRRAVLAIGACSALAAFVTLAWIAPISNQAFRSAASGIPYDRLAKGARELTLFELRAERAALDGGVMRGSVQARDLDFNYQACLTLSFTPIVLSLFALAFVDGRRRSGLAMLGAWAFSCCVVYWVMMMASDRAVMLAGAPALVIWLPNVMFVFATAVLRSRAHSRAQTLSTLKRQAPSTLECETQALST